MGQRPTDSSNPNWQRLQKEAAERAVAQLPAGARPLTARQLRDAPVMGVGSTIPVERSPYPPPPAPKWRVLADWLKREARTSLASVRQGFFWGLGLWLAFLLCTWAWTRSAVRETQKRMDELRSQIDSQTAQLRERAAKMQSAVDRSSERGREPARANDLQPDWIDERFSHGVPGQ